MEELNLDNGWPLPTFYFKVQFGNLGMITFREVTGFEVEGQELTYRSENQPDIPEYRRSGYRRHNIVTLRKGVFNGNSKIIDWLNVIQQESVVISLFDEGGSPTIVWKLSNAFPSRPPVIKWGQDCKECTVEQLELAYEDLIIEG